MRIHFSSSWAVSVYPYAALVLDVSHLKSLPPSLTPWKFLAKLKEKKVEIEGMEIPLNLSYKRPHF